MNQNCNKNGDRTPSRSVFADGTRDTITSLLLRQNGIPMSFWCNNDIIMPCVRWVFVGMRACITMFFERLKLATKAKQSIREVSLHVKHERVRVTAHWGAQFRNTLSSCTPFGFASRRDVSTEKQGHRHQQMARQQSIERARKQKGTHSP